jgi:hypothetical protein
MMRRCVRALSRLSLCPTPSPQSELRFGSILHVPAMSLSWAIRDSAERAEPDRYTRRLTRAAYPSALCNFRTWYASVNNEASLFTRSVPRSIQ